jgi:hypothetical protein
MSAEILVQRSDRWAITSSKAADNLPSEGDNTSGISLDAITGDPIMRPIYVALAALTLAGTIILAQSVTYDFDKRADFAAFRTYAWVRGTVVPDELNHQRVVDAICAQLAAKALTRVTATANPDVLVAYHASFDRDLQITGFSSGWGGYRFGGARSGTARTEEILTGTLIVDIVDADSKTIVWRGVAAKEINLKDSAEKRERNINRAAEKLFANYPPKPSRRSR